MKKLHITSLLLLVTIALFSQKRHYRLPENVVESDLAEDVIIVKFRKDDTTLKAKYLQKYGDNNLDRAIPIATQKIATHPLANIYKIRLNKGTNPIEEINRLLQDNNIEYAEPYFNHRPLLIPNDPEANPTTGKQTYLSVIKAYDAWTIEQGDSTIVIGILDSGTELDHPDLISQIAYNTNDLINGIDDDGDGLTDNYYGWDMADNDNNPRADGDSHGTEVSAMSSARVNNGIGMAGSGFKSKFLPIKIFTSNGNLFRYGYEAIALAADLGCQIINLSWGSDGSYSQFGQDVIDYVVLDKDVVVIAAAGNTNADLDFYPASFNNVLSVGATNMIDEKANFSTYSYKIDLMAPGKDIFTATNDGNYAGGKSGTSFSSPLVAGAAALLRARYPDFNALQIMEQLRASSDDIYGVGSNSTYTGKLGKGRLNMLRALTVATPSVRIDTLFYTNGLGEYAFREDTLSISVQLKNYLSSFNNGTVTLSSESGYVSIVNNSYSISRIGTLQEWNNYDSPFLVALSNDLPANETITFRLDYSDGVYDDFEYFEIQTSPDFYTVASGDLKLTISSDGDLGYDNNAYTSGIGVEFNSVNIAENIGVSLAFSQNTVIDNTPNELVNGIKDNDFSSALSLKSYKDNHAPVDARSVFLNGDSLRIEQKTIAPGDENYIIQEYRIVNLGSADLNNFALSIYSDWDLGNKDFNKAGWSGIDKLGFVYNEDTYAGIALLTDQDSIYSAINNRNFNGNSADIPTAITDSVKYAHASMGILQTEAGAANDGNDVSHLIGAHISSLPVNSAIKVAFVLLAGSSETALINLKNQALSFYQGEQNNPLLINITETCIGETASINPTQGDTYEFYDDVNLSNLLFTGSAFTTPVINAPVSYYVINKDQTFDSDIYKVIAKPKLVNADFSPSHSPLLFDETGNISVQFTDLSVDAVSWQWNFDNGFTAAIQNPLMNFTSTGTYSIQLDVVNDLGCEETIIKELIVANRSNLPDISDKEICKNEEVVLDATNATNLEFYADNELATLIHTGTSFTASFEKDTALFVISMDSLYSSNVKTVTIDVDDVKADFIHHPDTLDVSSNTLINFISGSLNQTLDIWYVNDQLASSNSSFTMNYEGLEYLEVDLIAESINSCTDTLTSIIPLLASNSPVSSDLEICENESVTINPSGQYLHFYADEALTLLEAKGSQIKLLNITGDTTIYITSNDNYIESLPLALVIDVNQLNATFSADPNVLNLTETSSTLFTDESSEATSWIWLLNNDTISIEQNPLIHFNEVGEYNISLTVMNDLGCTENTSMNYQVVSITGIEEEISNKISVFPNPANEHLIVKGKSITTATLSGIDGVAIYQFIGKDITFDVRNLRSGIYILALQTNEGSIIKKVIIQR